MVDTKGGSGAHHHVFLSVCVDVGWYQKSSYILRVHIDKALNPVGSEPHTNGLAVGSVSQRLRHSQPQCTRLVFAEYIVETRMQ